MRNVKRLLTVLFIVVPMAVGAIGIDTRITGIKMQPDFWAGVFPSVVSYMYEVSGIELIPGRTTSAGLELETGTLARSFKRVPETGELLSGVDSDSEQYALVENNDYDTLYAGFNLLAKQGFGQSRSGGDMITVSAGLKGRWEISLNPILDFGSRNGYPFYVYEPFQRAEEEKTYFPGTPDLSGNRQLFDIAFSVGANFKSLLNKVASSDGANVEIEAMYSPAFTNISKNVGGRSEFFKVLLNSSEAFMLYRKTDENNNNLWGLGISNAVSFRFLTGRNIPSYAEDLKLPLGWYQPENTTFMVEDIIRVDYYGRQFFKYFVPRASLFADLSYNWGKLNNSVEDVKMNTFCASAGIHVELLIAGKLSLYYEIGRVFAYTGPNADYYIGFRSTDQIKINLSVEF